MCETLAKPLDRLNNCSLVTQCVDCDVGRFIVERKSPLWALWPLARHGMHAASVHAQLDAVHSLLSAPAGSR